MKLKGCYEIISFAETVNWLFSKIFCSFCIFPTFEKTQKTKLKIEFFHSRTSQNDSIGEEQEEENGNSLTHTYIEKSEFSDTWEL